MESEMYYGFTQDGTNVKTDYQTKNSLKKDYKLIEDKNWRSLETGACVEMNERQIPSKFDPEEIITYKYDCLFISCFVDHANKYWQTAVILDQVYYDALPIAARHSKGGCTMQWSI